MGQSNHDNRETFDQRAGRPGGRRSNWRTALVLLSIALVFFLGFIAKSAFFG